MDFRRLLPDTGTLTATDAAAALRHDADPPPHRPYLALNMVATADGRITIGGRSGPIGNEADRRLFHELRAQVDAVMVGAGTVRTERYGRIVRDPDRRARRAAAGLEPDPLAVIVSARLDLPADLPLLQEPEQRVVVATGSDAELKGVKAQLEYLRVGDDLPLLHARLREEYGVRSILCEGGPTLNSHLLAAGLADELFLSLSPKVLGGAAAFTIVAGRELGEPAELEPLWVLRAGNELFTRWRVRTLSGE